MPGVTQLRESMTQRTRSIFSQARLAYWDDGTISAELKRLHDGLGRPVAVGVVGGTDDDRRALVGLVGRAGAGLVTVVADQAPDAVVLLPGRGGRPTMPPASTIGVLWGATDAHASALDGHVRALVALDPAADPLDLSGLRAALESLAADVETMRHAAALARVRRLVTDAPRRGADAICEAIDDIENDGPEPRELMAALALRSGGAQDLDPARRTAALGVLDAVRADPLARGRRTVTATDLAQWRTLASDPTLSRATRDLATTVGRACERLLAWSD